VVLEALAQQELVDLAGGCGRHLGDEDGMRFKHH
jgi:hypothetical protein